MKVAYVVGTFPSPSQTFVTNQILGVHNLGTEVTIYTTDYPELLTASNNCVEDLSSRIRSICPPKNYIVRLFKVFTLLVMHGWRVPRAVLRSINFFKHGRLAITLWLLYATLTVKRSESIKYDIVHSQFGPYGLLALKLLQVGALDGRLVVSFRGYDATKDLLARPKKYLELFRESCLFFPVSRSIAIKLIEAGCDERKIHVLHSGINCQALNFKHRQAPKRGPIHLISVGRLVEKKGIKYAVEAVSKVIASGRKVIYSVIGNGPAKFEIEEMVKNLALSETIRLLGWKSHEEVLCYLDTSHILLAPSVTSSEGDEEGIPNVIKEAMALGLPVISTVHAGIPELIVDGESGFLVPERSVDHLAERIVYLCDHPDIWLPLSQAARLKVETEFDIKKLSKDLVEFYAASLQQHATDVLQMNRPVMGSEETPAANNNPHRPKQGSQGN